MFLNFTGFEPNFLIFQYGKQNASLQHLNDDCIFSRVRTMAPKKQPEPEEQVKVVKVITSNRGNPHLLTS